MTDDSDLRRILDRMICPDADTGEYANWRSTEPAQITASGIWAMYDYWNSPEYAQKVADGIRRETELWLAVLDHVKKDAS